MFGDGSSRKVQTRGKVILLPSIKRFRNAFLLSTPQPLYRTKILVESHKSKIL